MGGWWGDMAGGKSEDLLFSVFWALVEYVLCEC